MPQDTVITVSLSARDAEALVDAYVAVEAARTDPGRAQDALRLAACALGAITMGVPS